jgi:hypothetical protein
MRLKGTTVLMLVYVLLLDLIVMMLLLIVSSSDCILLYKHYAADFVLIAYFCLRFVFHFINIVFSCFCLVCIVFS